MTVRLPNGSTFDLANTYAAAKTVTAITNANPAVASSTAHGLANGDIIEVTSGWNSINGSLVRVAGVTADTFQLEGINTLDTQRFPAGLGSGSVRKITAFVRVTQVLDSSSSGGEQQFYNYGLLEEQDDRQLPTTRSPFQMTLTVADDSSQTFVPVAESADRDRQQRGLRLNLPNGDIILYNGYVSFSKTPSLTRNQAMGRVMTFSQNAELTRYNA